MQSPLLQLTNESFVNIASLGASVLMSSAKKIQANNQAIEQETQAEETAKQAIQKEQEKQAKTSNEIKQRQAENEAAIKEKIETEKSLKKLQNTQRSHFVAGCFVGLVLVLCLLFRLFFLFLVGVDLLW
jgi:Fe2+ transport system protein B